MNQFVLLKFFQSPSSWQSFHKGDFAYTKRNAVLRSPDGFPKRTMLHLALCCCSCAWASMIHHPIWCHTIMIFVQECFVDGFLNKLHHHHPHVTPYKKALFSILLCSWGSCHWKQLKCLLSYQKFLCYQNTLPNQWAFEVGLTKA